MKILILTLLLGGSAQAVELTEEDKAMCTTLAAIGSDIQQHRRSHDTTQAETLEQIIPSAEWAEVYVAMADKVFQAPKAVPPASLAIDFNYHCRSEMQRIRDRESEL